MKGFVLVLLCALVAVQGRYTAVETSTRTRAALGENRHVVHMRIAVNYHGLLETCLGSLINERWILTASSCTAPVRFIWNRYGTVNVVNPSLVTENSITYEHPTANLALVDINRIVQTTENIAPIALATPGSAVPDTGKLCVFQGDDVEVPGIEMYCAELELSEGEAGTINASGDIQATRFDVGAPVVSNGVQVGIVTSEEGNVGTILAIGDYLPWIEQVTGITFYPEVEPEVIPDAVRIVN